MQKNIKEIGVEKFEFIDEYHGISPVLLIYLKNGKIMPVRENHFDEYIKLLEIKIKI